MMTVRTTKIKELRLVWNKINSRRKPVSAMLWTTICRSMVSVLLTPSLSKSNKFEKDGRETGNTGIFRSMLPPDKRLINGTNLEELVSEIREIIKV